MTLLSHSLSMAIPFSEDARAGADDLKRESPACYIDAPMTERSRRFERLRDPSDLPDVLQFMQLLWAVAHGLERTSKRMSLDFGVTGPQRLVLRVVQLFPGASAGDIADVLHLHPSTLTGILQRLVERGLLARGADPTDRRRSILRLSPRGARINAAALGTVEAAIQSSLNRLGPGELRSTRRVLQVIATELEAGASASSRRRRRSSHA
jgi:DNA-binding MarR family transcriptional regulator